MIAPEFCLFLRVKAKNGPLPVRTEAVPMGNGEYARLTIGKTA